MTTIVVGVDGSQGAADALRFAIEEARVRGAEVKAVNAWHVPPAAFGGGWVPPVVDLDEFREFARSSLEKAVEDVARSGSDVKVTPVLGEGQPADVLCAAATGADLLVVGSRGLGGFRGLRLGSVSQQCAHHAPCPVMIVPGSRVSDHQAKD